MRCTGLVEARSFSPYLRNIFLHSNSTERELTFLAWFHRRSMPPYTQERVFSSALSLTSISDLCASSASQPIKFLLWSLSVLLVAPSRQSLELPRHHHLCLQHFYFPRPWSITVVGHLTVFLREQMTCSSIVFAVTGWRPWRGPEGKRQESWLCCFRPLIN